jgi:hypothetical protein
MSDDITFDTCPHDVIERTPTGRMLEFRARCKACGAFNQVWGRDVSDAELRTELCPPTPLEDVDVRLNKLGDFMWSMAETFDDVDVKAEVKSVAGKLHTMATRLRRGASVR